MIVTAPCFLQKLLCPLLNFKRVWRWRQKWNTFDWNLRPPLLVSGQMKGGGLDRLDGLDCMGRNCLLCLGGVGRNNLGWLLPPPPGLGWGSSADQGHALARYSILDLVSPSHISLVYWTYSLKQSCLQVAQHITCSETTLQEILCWRSPLGTGLCLMAPAVGITLSGEGGGGRLVSTSLGRDT